MQRIVIDNDSPNQPEPIQGNGNIVSEAEAIKTADNANIPPLQWGDTPQSGELTPGTAPGSVSVGSLIDGKTAVELMDAVLPAALVFVMYKAGIVLKKTELQLTEREKNTLAPLMAKCMDALMLNFDSPFVALGVSMAVIYGGKIMEKGGIAFIDRKTSEAKAKADNKGKPVDKVEAAIASTASDKIAKAGANIAHSFTPENIQAFRKQRRISYAKAIPLMIKMQSLGKIDHLGNQIS